VTQNIYDDENFFAAYSRLPRSIEGLAGAVEWPLLRELLPNLNGLRILDLGCGFGWFCRWARANGAASVTAVDVSARMLERARAATDDPAIDYVQADLESFQVPAASFELVYSSLAFHYLENLKRLLSAVHDGLTANGKLVFSVEHPIYTAPAHPGWCKDAQGETAWPVNRYFEEGARSTDWLVKGVIKQHRTLAAYFEMLLHSGFTISHVREWGPSKEQIATHPDWTDERHRPLFLLIACNR
jgi:SAM-dependent methyltransferase